VDDAGAAGALDVTLTAANLADLAFSVSRRDANFRQLGEDPTYVTDNVFAIGGTMRLERFFPDAWGLAAPLTVRHTASSSAPFYLGGTDLRADALQGLRTPSTSASGYGLTVRHARRSEGTLGRWLLDPLSLSGSYASGDARTSLDRAGSSAYGVSLDYGFNPRPATVSAVPKFVLALLDKLPGFLRHSQFIEGLHHSRLRVNPAGFQFHSSFFGSAASRSTYQVPVATDSDRFIRPARSLARGWRNSASVDLQPFESMLLRADLSSQRDLRDYGDSTTLGLLTRGARRSLLGHDVGLETQRSLNTLLSLTPSLTAWARPRLTFATTFVLRRDPNASGPVRDVGDTAGAFRLPAAFSNSQRLDLGARLDPRRLGQGLFGDSARVTRWLGRVTPIDLTYTRTRLSTFDRAPQTPSFGYQLPVGGFDGFRQEDGKLAGGASETENLSAIGGTALFLGLRANAVYAHSRTVTWVLRTDQQVPVRSRSLEWPSGTISWSIVPPRNSIGRVLTTITAQLGYRERVSSSEQSAFGGGAINTALTRTVERGVTPSVSLGWLRGILSSFDASRVTSDQITAGNLFHTLRDQRNAVLVFSFRPPKSILPLRTDIRTNARYTLITNTTCLQAAGQAECVLYVDSRQSQSQLTMDTDFPPSLSAGFQMAYAVHEERQFSRKTAQLVITAFVQLSTTVGQLR